MSGNKPNDANHTNVTRSWGNPPSSSPASSDTQDHGTSNTAATGDDPMSRWKGESQQDQPWDGVGNVQSAESTHAATTAVTTTTTNTANGKSEDHSNKATTGGSIETQRFLQQ